MEDVCNNSIVRAQEPALCLRDVNMQELLICAFCCSMRIDNNNLDAAQHEHGIQSSMNVYLNAAERRSPSLLMVSMTAKG